MYFRVEQDGEAFTFVMTKKFYDYAYPYFNQSYLNILYRLFNLLPKDFYHYIGYKYHAQYQKSKNIPDFIRMSFKTEADAKAFCKEANRRFKYCVDRGDFV